MEELREVGSFKIRELANFRGTSELDVVQSAFEVDGTKKGAADALGMSRQGLDDWLDRHELQVVKIAKVVSRFKIKK